MTVLQVHSSPQVHAPSQGPALSGLERGAVYLDLEEKLEGKSTKVNYGRAILYRYLAHHGFSRAKRRSRARYVIRGSLACRYDKAVYFEYEGAKILIEHQFVGTAALEVTDCESTDKKFVALAPLAVRSGMKNRDSAADGVRRQLATAAAQAVTLDGPLREPVPADAIQSLENPNAPASADAVVAGLVKEGNRAVPYCLDCFLESRPVALKQKPQQLRTVEKKELLTYHLADRALAKIFGQRAFFTAKSADDRVAAFEYWMRKWQRIQSMPDKYKLPPKGRSQRRVDRPNP